MTIGKALIEYSNILKSKGFESADLDIEVLLCHILKCERIDLLNNRNVELNLEQHNKFVDLYLRREKHEPIAYLINRKEFCSYEFFINNNVLIPRPITEELVKLIFDDISRNTKGKYNIIDVGTGSGAIIISLFNKLKYKNEVMGGIYKKDLCNFYATDISKKAIEIAMINAKKYEAIKRINFLQGNLKFPKGVVFDYIVANLPYLYDKNIDFNKDNSKDLMFEPKVALFSNRKGLGTVKRLLKKARKYLDEDGKIYLEIEKGELEILKKMFRKIYKFEGYCEDRIVVVSFL